MTWVLKLIRRGNVSIPIPIRQSPTVLGRHGSCQIQLACDSVSRRHCELSVMADKLVAVDCGSLNGTQFNCQRLRGEVELRSGDVIRIGPHLLLVDRVTAADPFAAAESRTCQEAVLVRDGDSVTSPELDDKNSTRPT